MSDEGRARVIVEGIRRSFPSARESFYRPGTALGVLESVTHELGHILAAEIPLSRAKRQRAGKPEFMSLEWYVQNIARGEVEEFSALAIERMVFEYLELPLDLDELLRGAHANENFRTSLEHARHVVLGKCEVLADLRADAKMIARWYLYLERRLSAGGA